MLPWLVENFNGGSCMFTIATGKEFVITRNDICDVFCLPLSGICVPELNKNFEDESVHKRIIQAWRSDYGLFGKQPLHLSKLDSRMVDLVDGGEEFKRCFVLQAMSSFLAPTTNRNISLKLLKAVEKVVKIKTFDWCSYVLKKLKKVVQKYKDDETAQNGPLDTFTYPVSQLNLRETVFKTTPTLGYDKGASTSGTTGRIVAFELPEVSQTEQLFYDPHYLKILDGLIDECNKMKFVHDLFCGFYEPTEGNKDVVPEKEPAQGFNENIPKDDDNGHGKIVNEGLNGFGPSAIIPGPTENIPIGHIYQNEPARRIIRANKSLCSLDCGPVGVQVPLVTPFLKSNAWIFRNLPKLHLEILDYCLLKDVSMNRNESLVTFGMNFLIPREDMVSLVAPLRIRWCIIDCYCLYLNEKACFEATGPQKFFFGVRQSVSNISSAVKDLHDLWEGWVSYENPECDITDADLCVQMGAFLGKRNHPKSSQLPSYGFEVVELEWRKEKTMACLPGLPDKVDILHFFLSFEHLLP
uniref:Uncharacterized protein n=1 Tax=Chenopodium quinoa TaxID=63459 RepID=A0A803N8J7_CHEQI